MTAHLIIDEVFVLTQRLRERSSLSKWYLEIKSFYGGKTMSNRLRGRENFEIYLELFRKAHV